MPGAAAGVRGAAQFWNLRMCISTTPVRRGHISARDRFKQPLGSNISVSRTVACCWLSSCGLWLNEEWAAF